VTERLRVALLAGGRSSEHDISLASARGVLEALGEDEYEVVTVAIDRDGRWELGQGSDRRALRPGHGTGPAETLPVPAERGTLATLGSVDVVIPMLHGPFGEDGSLQGVLEQARIPYVGAGVAASALCMDKDLFKKVMRDSGVPVARHVALRLRDPIRNPFGYPCFVKPASLGSSVGITKVRSEDELAPAVELARQHDEKVLVEEFVPGIEIEVGVLGNLEPVASLAGKVVSHYADWYDWSSKYDEGGSELIVPPPELSQQQLERAQELAVSSFVATDCEGMARVDFFVRESDGEVIVNELNTIPGFTPTSFYARLFAESGIAYPELIRRLIELALERHERRRGLRY
jgi:D-alanine-D-alanine ligase